MHLKAGMAYAEKILIITPKPFDMITKPNG
jgi:hypothetical protein